MRLALVCFYCLCVFVYVLYFIATMSFAGYFLPVLFCMLSMLISDSRFDLVWFRLSCDHGWIRSGSVNVRKRQQQQQSSVHRQRVPRRDSVFPQAVPRVGADNFALYHRGSGKMDRQIPGHVRKERTSEGAADVVDLSSRIPYGHKFSRGRRRNVVRSGVAVLLVVPSARTFRVREWARAPGFLFDARLPDFLSWRCSG